MKKWYTIQASAANPSVTDINVFDDIGMWGINAKQFLTDVKNSGADTIRLFINSPGGSVFDAVTMFNGLRMSGKRIEVTVLGVAASAASFLALAGDHIVMPDNTFMFIHNPISAVYGNAEDMRDTADALDKIGSSITAMYAKRWKGSAEELSAALAAESYLTAAECLALGLCDEVTEAMPVTARFDTERLPENVRAMFEARKPAEPVAAPVPTVTLALRIDAAAAIAGLGEFAAAWAVDPGITDDAGITARIAEALEIKAVCEVAQMADHAAGFIRNRVSLKDARATLCEAMAEADATTQIDTSAPAKTVMPPAASSINIADVYAKANSQSKRSK